MHDGALYMLETPLPCKLFLGYYSTWRGKYWPHLASFNSFMFRSKLEACFPLGQLSGSGLNTEHSYVTLVTSIYCYSANNSYVMNSRINSTLQDILEYKMNLFLI